MLCVVSFVILLFASIVSRKYRKLLGKAWHCVSRRARLKPCDTSFGAEVKTTLLAPLAIRAPRLVKPLSVIIEIFAWVMMISMIVTVYILLRSGLNLAVHGTCNPRQPEACGLAAASCGISAEIPTFSQSLREGAILTAFQNEFTQFTETVQAVPNLFRNWNPEEFLPAYASFKHGFHEELPIALEVIDPGCWVCGQMFINLAESGFDAQVNLAYIPFAILDEETGDPHFPNSVRITNILTALRIFEYEKFDGVVDNPTDWLLLNEIFTGTRPGTDIGHQMWFNNADWATPSVMDAQLVEWLESFGTLSEIEIVEVFELADSERVQEVVNDSRHVVRHEIRTATIPTLLTPGRMSNGLVEIDRLIRFGERLTD